MSLPVVSALLLFLGIVCLLWHRQALKPSRVLAHFRHYGLVVNDCRQVTDDSDPEPPFGRKGQYRGKFFFSTETMKNGERVVYPCVVEIFRHPADLHQRMAYIRNAAVNDGGMVQMVKHKNLLLRLHHGLPLADVDHFRAVLEKL